MPECMPGSKYNNHKKPISVYANNKFIQLGTPFHIRNIANIKNMSIAYRERNPDLTVVRSLHRMLCMSGHMSK